MKIYTERNKEADSVEISLNYQELRKMVISLKKFEDKVSQFKLKNKDKKDTAIIISILIVVGTLIGLAFQYDLFHLSSLFKFIGIQL